VMVSDGNDLDQLLERGEVIGVAGVEGQVHRASDRCNHQVDGPRTSRVATGGDDRCGFVVHGREDVGLDLKGGRDVGVAEPFLDDSRVDAVLERDRRPGVP
jgi:hypothetical protein